MSRKSVACNAASSDSHRGRRMRCRRRRCPEMWQRNRAMIQQTFFEVKKSSLSDLQACFHRNRWSPSRTTAGGCHFTGPQAWRSADLPLPPGHAKSLDHRPGFGQSRCHVGTTAQQQHDSLRPQSNQGTAEWLSGRSAKHLCPQFIRAAIETFNQRASEHRLHGSTEGLTSEPHLRVHCAQQAERSKTDTAAVL